METEWNLDFYFDLEINTTHVEDHGFTLKAVFILFESGMYLERKRKDGSFEATGFLGMTEAKVIYRKLLNQKNRKHFFVITAYKFTISELDLLRLEELNEN